MSVADEVYAKHKNGRYYKGEVVDITTQLYYCVLFDDNSTSKDLFPEDIIVSLTFICLKEKSGIPYELEYFWIRLQQE